MQWAPRLIPGFFRSPKWVPWVGWLLVAGAVFGLSFHALGIALGDYFYEDEHVKIHLAGKSPATIILLVSAGLTLSMALPAMIALRRTTAVWPLRLLRDAALLFTFLNALVDLGDALGRIRRVWAIVDRHRKAIPATTTGPTFCGCYTTDR